MSTVLRSVVGGAVGRRFMASCRHNSTLSPAVARLIRTNNVDPASIKASGPKNNLLKGDVLKALKDGTAKALASNAAGASAPAADSKPSIFKSYDEDAPEWEDIATTNIRKVIARRLTESKTTVPHYYTQRDIVIDPLLARRKGLEGPKPSVNDFVIRACALALRDVPGANAAWMNDGPVELDAVDISVAVATPTGLITPIIKNADRKRVAKISTEMRDLATRAKDNKLKPEEFQGGSFSVSNLGGMGIDDFVAVINPPQSIIMAVGRGRKVVLSEENLDVEALAEAMDNASATPEEDAAGTAPAVQTVMTVTLSSDARVVDETVAGEFLDAFDFYINSELR